MLPPDGVILQRVAAPSGDTAYCVALTRLEFDAAFAITIRPTLSWEFGYCTSEEFPGAGRDFVIR